MSDVRIVSWNCCCDELLYKWQAELCLSYYISAQMFIV